MKHPYHLVIFNLFVKDNILKRDKTVGFVHCTNFGISFFAVKEHEAPAYLLIDCVYFFRCDRKDICEVNRILTGGK